MPTKLILIRHGETDYNQSRRYCGATDKGLNDRGRAQAKQLSRQLEKEKIDALYSSDMARAVETAAIAFKDFPIREIAGFREIDFGIFEGLTHEEVLIKYRDIYQGWLNDPLTAMPEGESLTCLAKRVRNALNQILNAHPGQRLALVTHGGPIRVMLCDALGLALKEIWGVIPKPASIHILNIPGNNDPVGYGPARTVNITKDLTPNLRSFKWVK